MARIWTSTASFALDEALATVCRKRNDRMGNGRKGNGRKVLER